MNDRDLYAYYADLLEHRVFADKSLGDLELMMRRLLPDTDDPSNYSISSFCYWLDLGFWFESELESIDFDVGQFMSDMRSKLEDERKEDDEYHNEVAGDLRRAQGWPW